MQTVNGFVEITALSPSQQVIIAPVGQLSTYSLTYSRNIGSYEHSANQKQGYQLIVFKSKNDQDQDVVVAQAVVDEIIAVVEGAYLYASNHTQPYNPNDFRSSLQNSFSSRIEGLILGELVESSPVGLPSWLYWQSITTPNVEVKIWLSDNAFRSQYEGYELRPIPPFTPVDDFFLSSAAVVAKLGQITPEITTQAIQTEIGQSPTTLIKSIPITYYRPLTHAPLATVHFQVLVYGIQGDNLSVLKSAIATYLLNHSNHPQNDWAVILPDLFRTDEFVMMPRWDRVAIPAVPSIIAGSYSPLSNIKEDIAFAKSHTPTNYSDIHIDDNLESFTHPYKNVKVLSVGSPTNLEDKNSLIDLFEDYLPLLTGSLDFERMDDNTQAFVTMMETLLMAAETLSESSVLPTGVRRIRRNGIRYVGKDFNNVTYLVLAKNNLG